MAEKKAKFVDIQVETFLENTVYFNAKSLFIIVDFLGSCHLASEQPGSGVQYGKHKDVYYRLKPSSNERGIIFTFSGPTLLDIKKPNIKSITKEAKEILDDLISNINILTENILKENEQIKEKNETGKVNIVIYIKGHSRGGVVANNIYRWISKNFSEYKVKLEKLVIADPYAGPINRIIKKKNDDFDYVGMFKNIPKSKIVVYTVVEKRFRGPAKSLNSDVIVFTDAEHSATRYIANYVFDSGFEKGLFICHDSNSELQKIYIAVKKDPTKKEQHYIDEWFKRHIQKVTKNNIIRILQGAEKYKNFAYNKIASDGRRLMFYSALSKEPELRNCVQKFLEDNGHESMWKKVEKTLKKINI